MTHTYTRQDFSGRGIGPSQRPLSDNTQHSLVTDIHGPGGIRTRNSSQRAPAALRLRPRGRCDRHLSSHMYNLVPEELLGFFGGPVSSDWPVPCNEMSCSKLRTARIRSRQGSGRGLIASHLRQLHPPTHITCYLKILIIPVSHLVMRIPDCCIVR